MPAATGVPMFGGRHIPIRIYVGGIFIVLTLAIGISMAGLFYARMKSAIASTSADLFARTAAELGLELHRSESRSRSAGIQRPQRPGARGHDRRAARLHRRPAARSGCEPVGCRGVRRLPDGRLLRAAPAAGRPDRIRRPRSQRRVRALQHGARSRKAAGPPRHPLRPGVARSFPSATIPRSASIRAPGRGTRPRNLRRSVTAPYVFAATGRIGDHDVAALACRQRPRHRYRLGERVGELARLRPTPSSEVAIVASGGGGVIAFSDPAAFARDTADFSGERTPLSST